MKRKNTRKLSKKEERAKKKADALPVVSAPIISESRTKETHVALPAVVGVQQFAQLADRKVSEIISALLRNGVMAGINDSIDRETAAIVGEELGITVSPEEAGQIASTISESEQELTARPPVVVVLGHVDHGKTTLLDAIRETNVTSTESGGITQHIGAYQVTWKNKDGSERPITFLDTPGHEAFSAMRAHGVTMTDIAILVIAADDGVKPQTKEALSHARAANVPVIIAVTKTDKEGANIDRIKGQLAEIGLSSEDWGGKTPLVPLSAKTREGIDDLLDTILLVADLQELTARSAGKAEGVVIESLKAPGLGPVATVLVRQGSLQIGDSVVVGNTFGRVRFLEDEHGNRHQSVGPATPIRLAGLSGVPQFGALVNVVDSERIARVQALATSGTNRPKRAAEVSAGIDDEIEDKAAVILKADVEGSLKALEQSFAGLEHPIRILHAEVGAITESDVHLAATTGALVLGFRVAVTPVARRIAEQHGVRVLEHDIIYDLIEEVETETTPERKLVTEIVEAGKLKVLAIFRRTKKMVILGGAVNEGKALPGTEARIERDSVVIGTGKVTSVRRGQFDVPEIAAGEECGLSLDTTATIDVGDTIVFLLEQSVS